jgi:hypothetical protein
MPFVFKFIFSSPRRPLFCFAILMIADAAWLSPEQVYLFTKDADDLRLSFIIAVT